MRHIMMLVIYSAMMPFLCSMGFYDRGCRPLFEQLVGNPRMDSMSVCIQLASYLLDTWRLGVL